MTFPKACAALKRGAQIYRPGWPAGNYLTLQNIKGGDVICKYEDHKSAGIWLADPGDLIAADWACDVFVLLPADQPCMQPGA